jgi:purine catabolism regulator
MPYLHEIVDVLGEDLRPYESWDYRNVFVTGVHISELSDPTHFLDGSELLLSTGLQLTDPDFDVKEYVQVMHSFGIAAYGLGLGPYFDEVPATLAEACSAIGLPLFVVPSPTPFRTINDAFWRLQMEDQSAELVTLLDRQSALIQASASKSPTITVLSELATMGNWASHVGPTGNVTTVMPEHARKRAEAAAVELQNLGHQHPYFTTTFSFEGMDILTQSWASQGHIMGSIMFECTPPLTTDHRRLTTTATALLEAQLHPGHRQKERRRGLQAAVLHLFMIGQHEAALALSSRIPDVSVPEYGQLFAFRVPSTADVAMLAEHLELLSPDTHRLLRTDDVNREVWMLLGVQEAEHALPVIRNHLRSVNPRIKTAISRPGPVHNLATMSTAVWSAIRFATDDNWIDLSLNTMGATADVIIQKLENYSRADLISTVQAYLRHRGQWEEAARDLHVHRNTLRHRMTIAQRITQADFDDPDIASVLWLRLRDETPGL